MGNIRRTLIGLAFIISALIHSASSTNQFIQPEAESNNEVEAFTKSPVNENISKIPTPFLTHKLLRNLNSFKPTSVVHKKPGTYRPATMLSKILRVSSLQKDTNDGQIVKDENPLELNDLGEEEVNMKRRRVKRFTCWHSCLGPWKKRNPRTKIDPFKWLGKPEKSTSSKPEEEEPEGDTSSTAKPVNPEDEEDDEEERKDDKRELAWLENAVKSRQVAKTGNTL